ncbi:MAG: polysaccharide deacetylase family protein [Bacteroidaceae bacterium]|nr:polysaccharide deacetylase family protein [Bacteroidaceae bacterium]MBP5348419.1 polysaccharide deacetylase family protein [Bacteroidaceae bacterium]MBR3660169.1 polysaccharide deacetylase family protein [Bacteroidaceae bacterium]
MLLEQPTKILSKIYPKGIFRKDPEEKAVYLTFDDGPIPEVTPWLLEVLDRYGIKATFFVVGDNVRKYPEIFKMLVDKGHKIGNHTFNHVRSMRMRNPDYIDNVKKCESYFKTRLFRPPHGIMRRWSYRYMTGNYDIVFYDVITRDYNGKLKPEKVLDIVKKYTRNGSIIVFHDSLRSEKNLRYALPKAIEWLNSQGYAFKSL